MKELQVINSRPTGLSGFILDELLICSYTTLFLFQALEKRKLTIYNKILHNAGKSSQGQFGYSVTNPYV